MFCKMSRLTMGFSLMALIATFAPERADAGAFEGMGYVCSVQHNPYNGYSTYGDHGYIFVQFYSEAYCGGSYLGYGYVYSENATSSYASSSVYFYPKIMFESTYQALLRALEAGQKVYIESGSSSNQIYYIRFHP